MVARRASTVTGYSHTSPSFTIKRRKLTSLLLTKRRSDLGVILGTPKEFSLRQLCMAVLWRQFETAFPRVSNGLFHFNYGCTPKEFSPRQLHLRQSSRAKRTGITSQDCSILQIHVSVPFFVSCSGPEDLGRNKYECVHAHHIKDLQALIFSNPNT